jgi:hypothetical protein
MLHAQISKAGNQLGGTSGFDQVPTVDSRSPFCGSGLRNHEIERVTPDGDHAILTTTVIDERSPVIYPLYQ